MLNTGLSVSSLLEDPPWCWLAQEQMAVLPVSERRRLTCSVGYVAWPLDCGGRVSHVGRRVFVPRRTMSTLASCCIRRQCTRKALVILHVLAWQMA